MGILMITCPSTGQPVSTGIEMIAMDQLPVVVARVNCTACGHVHEWTKKDAWLVEGGSQYRTTQVTQRVPRAAFTSLCR